MTSTNPTPNPYRPPEKDDSDEWIDLEIPIDQIGRHGADDSNVLVGAIWIPVHLATTFLWALLIIEAFFLPDFFRPMVYFIIALLPCYLLSLAWIAGFSIWVRNQAGWDSGVVCAVLSLLAYPAAVMVANRWIRHA